jgi:hypothetical protein
MQGSFIEYKEPLLIFAFARTRFRIEGCRPRRASEMPEPSILAIDRFCVCAAEPRLITHDNGPGRQTKNFAPDREPGQLAGAASICKLK